MIAKPSPTHTADTDAARSGASRTAVDRADIHLALTHAAVDARSLSDLAHAVSPLLGREVVFADQEGVLLGARHMDDARRARERTFVLALHQTGDLKRIQDSVSPVLVAALPALGTQARLGCAVRIGGGLVAIAWLDDGGAAFSTDDARALEHAALVAALHLAHQRALANQETRLGYAFVASLLEGKFEDTPGARSRAAANGWNPDGLYHVCLILLDEPLPLSRGGLLRMERLEQRLRQYLSCLGESALIFVSLNQLQFLLPAAHRPEPLWHELGGQGAAMGVSRALQGATGVAQAGADVQSLVPLLKPGRIHHFDEVLFPQALLGDADARRLLIDKRLGPLQGEKTEALLETLEALCEEGFQLAGTSRRLGVHISTLRYRIERIEALLGVSLEDQPLRFELQVAVALWRLTQ